MEKIKITELFDLKETIAAELFEGLEYPWEALELINEFILKLGARLPEDLYVKQGENIWIARNAVVAPTASLTGPLIIDEEAKIRHCAFIRGGAIVGKGAVVGNSTELKNSVLFNKVQVPHYNYVGDSILGYASHMGAASITSNVKSDKTLVVIKGRNKQWATGRRKVGAILGDHVEIGCGSVLNPGTIIGPESSVYPLSMVRGVIPEKSIYKKAGDIITRQEG